MPTQAFAVASLLIISATIGARTIAATPPPTLSFDEITPTAIHIEPVTEISIGSVNVQLERTTFEYVEVGLGAAPIQQRGDAAGFQMWVCYTLRSFNARLWLTSSELGGHKYIDGFVLKEISANEDVPPDCPTPAHEIPRIGIDHDIRLGMSFKDLTHRLGTPNYVDKASAYFAYIRKKRDFDVSSFLFVKHANGRIVEMTATHSTTN